MSVLVISESENEGEQLMENAEATETLALDEGTGDEELVVAARLSDERANVPVSEVTERFLRAILAKVPLDRIEELHLFSPLRQGTVETGIAVVAARVIVVEEPDTSALELELEAGNEVYVDDAMDVDTSVDASVDAAVDATVDAEVEVSVDAEIEVSEDSSIDATVDVESDDAVSAGDNDADEVEAVTEVALEHAAEFIAEEDDSPYADEPQSVVRETDADSEIVAAEGVEIAIEETEDAVVPLVPRIRHTVYTARYRLVVKGPERGKWEMDVVDEADAPLLAVETVVRGVQRRAGEETATVRYDSHQLARALRIPFPESL
ncbi:MAG: hypothetical protein ABI852_02375 [Gemmatimonadaceae bacterium]